MTEPSRKVGVVAPRPRTADPVRSTPAGLLRRCREGDEDAWAELVSRYERLVFGVATHEGLTVEDAADVTQTVFEALFISLPELRDDDRLSSWLFAVARRQAWRVRERSGRERLSAATVDGADRLPLWVSQQDATDEVERSLWLHEALQELGEPCRSLLIALYFDPSGPSYAEVALRLGRPIGSIGPSRARCLEHLRVMLGRGAS